MTEYRDWTIRYSPMPLPTRDSDYTAIPKNFALGGDWRIMHGPDEETLKRRIDYWEDHHVG